MTSLSGNRIIPKSITVTPGNKTINLDLFINQPCTVTNNGYLTINGILSGTQDLTFFGSGTTDVTNGSNTYNGKISLISGTLKISGNSKVLTRGTGGDSSGNAYLINSILEHSSTEDLIINNPIATAQYLSSLSSVYNRNPKIISNGPGKIHFRNPYGDNRFNGTLEINTNGYVKVGNNDTIKNGTKGTGTGTIHATSNIVLNGTLELDRSPLASFANVNAKIDGSGLIKLTRGNFIFDTIGGPINHSGTFNIDSGTATFNRPPNSQFVNNGTLILNMSDPNYWQNTGNLIFSKSLNGSTTTYALNTDYVFGTASNGSANAQIQNAGLGNDMTEFSGFVAGRIALVQRGVQPFQTKVNNAIAAGAVGVIIYNNTTGLTTPSVTASIPVIMLTQVLGQQMVTEINSGTVTTIMDSGVPSGASLTPSFNNSITGTGILSKSGTGIIVIGSNANHSGPTNITAGALRITGNDSLPNSSVVVSSGAAFEILGGSTFSRNISTNGTGVSSGGAIRNISGDNTLSGNITQVAASRINSDVGTLTLNNAGTLSGTFGLTFGGAGNILVQRVIGITTGTVTKDGAGTLTLTADNTYTGATTVSAGTLVVGNGGTTGTITSASVATGSTLTFNRSNDYTYAGVLSGAGTVVKQNTGALILTGANTHTGSFTLSAGTLQIGNGGTTGSTNSVIANNTSVIFNRSNALTHSAVISGTGSVTNSGTGTTSLTGANTYTGGTTISAGGISVGTNGLSGSIVGDVTNNGTLTFNRSDAYTFAGIISGTGNVVKSGGATTTTLSGNSTYTGTTTISAGALRVAHVNALGSTSSVSVAASTALELTGGIAFARNLSSAGTGVSSGGSLRSVSGNNTFDGNYTLTAASRINSDADTLTLSNVGTLSGAFNLTFGGAGNVLVQRVIATSTGTVTKDGAGTLTLTADNTYTGATGIGAGTLVVGNGGTTGTISSSVSVAAGSTLTFNRSNDYTYAGVISGTGSVIKQNTGVLILTGASSHTGTFTVSAGILQIGNGGTTGSTNSVIANNTSVIFNRSNALTHSAVISGTGSVTNSGTGTTTLSGANTYTGGTTISSGGITIGAGSTTGSIVGDVTNNGTLTFNRSDAYAYAGVISGTGNVAKSAAGTITLSGNNTYSGTTTITTGGGALRVAHANALGSATSTISIPSTAAIELTGGITFSRNLSSATTGISNGGSLRNISGNNTFDGNYTLTAGSRINSDADTLTLSNVGTLSGTFGLTFGGSGNVLVQRAIATSTGTVTKDGTGTLVLSASNTYTGVTTLSGGTTRFATTDSLYNGNTASWTRTNIIVNTGAVFAINVGGANEFTTTNVNTLLTNLLTTINNNGLRSGSSIGFDTSNSASDFTISNNITDSSGTGAGAVGLVKLGTGTLVLSGTSNTYTGGTVINGGTLKAGNATCFGTGTITINAGAILDRAGFTITNTVVSNGGTIIN